MLEKPVKWTLGKGGCMEKIMPPVAIILAVITLIVTHAQKSGPVVNGADTPLASGTPTTLPTPTLTPTQTDIPTPTLVCKPLNVVWPGDRFEFNGVYVDGNSIVCADPFTPTP